MLARVNQPVLIDFPIGSVRSASRHTWRVTLDLIEDNAATRLTNSALNWAGSQSAGQSGTLDRASTNQTDALNSVRPFQRERSPQNRRRFPNRFTLGRNVNS